MITSFTIRKQRSMRYILFILCVFVFSSAQAEGEIGTYIVNGVTFKIPKAALLIKQSEGENEGVTLLLKWPELTPAKWEGDQSKVIKVGIEVNKDQTGNVIGLEGPLDSADLTYHRRAGWLNIMGDGKYKLDNPDPVFLGYIDSIELDYYKLRPKGKSASSIDNWYINGNPMKPDRWYECQVNCNTRCETVISLSKQIYIAISHRRDLFHYHNGKTEIIPKVISKIQSFIQQ